MANSYKTLTVGSRFLANFQSGDVSAGDLTACEEWAFNLINEEFARAGFDVTGWSGDDIPPAVADLADEIASMRAWVFKFMKDGQPPPQSLGEVEVSARQRIGRLRRSGLLTSAAGRIASDSPSVMRVQNPES